ncbi:hypothetical protein GGS24DRAFT_517609 [Hypoxylon argillaceum]|nr:hypothetical protein GGS24DRAFT_517609 [Hypoxylon argillaceum]
MAEQPPNPTPTPLSAITLNMLAKFVHVDCWGHTINQCYPYLEAIALDATNFHELEESVKDALHRRIGGTHPAPNLTFHFLYTIEWAGHKECMSGNLEHMSEEVFRNQFHLVQKRGHQDTLVVKYFYIIGPPGPGPDEPHTECVGSVGGGSNMPMPEEIHGFEEANAMAQGEPVEYPAYPHVGGYEGHLGVDAEQNGDTDGETMATAVGRDGNGNSHNNSSPGPSNSDPKCEPPVLATPACASTHWGQSIPVSLVIYGGGKKILQEVPLISPGQTEIFKDKPSAEPPHPRVVSKIGNHQGSTDSTASLTTLLNKSACISDPEETKSNTSFRKGKEPASPTLAHNHARVTRQPTPIPRTADVDQNNNGGPNGVMLNQSRMVQDGPARGGRGNDAALTHQANLGSTSTRLARTASGSRHAYSIFSPRPPRFVHSLSSMLEVSAEQPGSACADQSL